MTGEKGMQEVALAKPESGQTGAIVAVPAHVYVLDFDPAEANCELTDGNVQWRFDNGAVLVLKDFFNAASSGPLYLQTSDGAMILGSDLVEALVFDPNSMPLERTLLSLDAGVEFPNAASLVRQGQEDTPSLPGNGISLGDPHHASIIAPPSEILFVSGPADTLQLQDLLDTSEHLTHGESTVSLASVFEDLSLQSGQPAQACQPVLLDSAFYAFAPDDMDSLSREFFSLTFLFL